MRPEVRRAVARLKLALPRRALTGRIGDRLGRGLGASIEFEEHRAYRPGDDLRHVDWRAYARTDRLDVKLFREEVAPVVDLIVDTSASMASTPAKAQALTDLVDALLALTAGDGSRARCHVAGGGSFEPGRALALDGADRGLVPRAGLHPRGLRIVVSDFLTPDDLGPALRRIAANAAHLYAIQLLDPSELEPTPAGATTLVDVETGGRTDLVLDAATVANYRERLRRLCDDVAAAVRGVAGTCALVRAGEPAAMLSGDLLRQGVVVPA